MKTAPTGRPRWSGGCERGRGWRTGASSLAASAKLGADTGGRAGRVKAPSARRRPRGAAGGLPASSRRRKRRPPRRAGRAAGTYRLPGQPGRAASERVSGLCPCRRVPAACEPLWSLVSRREDRGQRVPVLAPWNPQRPHCTAEEAEPRNGDLGVQRPAFPLGYPVGRRHGPLYWPGALAPLPLGRGVSERRCPGEGPRERVGLVARGFLISCRNISPREPW